MRRLIEWLDDVFTGCALVVALVVVVTFLATGCASGATPAAPQAPQDDTSRYPKVQLHHYDMPEGFPAVWTFCEGTTRFGVTYQAAGGDHNNPSLSIAAATDATCVR